MMEEEFDYNHTVLQTVLWPTTFLSHRIKQTHANEHKRFIIFSRAYDQSGLTVQEDYAL